MDKIDVRLIRELVQGQAGNVFRREFRLSSKSLATRLRIPEATARDRVEKILRSGYLNKWTLVVNPPLVGVNLQAWGFDVPSSTSKEELVERLTLLPEVVIVINYHGSHLGLVFYYLDAADLERKIKLISKLSSAQNSYLTGIPFPPCDMRLLQTDWRIITSLQSNIRRSYGEIAEELGLSPRTIKRRLTKMLANRAVFILASSDPQKMFGSVLADFIVSYDGGGIRPESESQVIRVVLDEFLIASAIWLDFSVYNTIVPNLPQARKLLDAIRRQTGVKSVRLELVAERIERYEILKEQVDRKMAQALTSL